MSWMAWTWPTAAFFICIGGALILMTVLELLKPTEPSQGFLPIVTTRGDRFFYQPLERGIYSSGLAGSAGKQFVCCEHSGDLVGWRVDALGVIDLYTPLLAKTNKCVGE